VPLHGGQHGCPGLLYAAFLSSRALCASPLCESNCLVSVLQILPWPIYQTKASCSNIDLGHKYQWLIFLHYNSLPYLTVLRNMQTATVRPSWQSGWEEGGRHVQDTDGKRQSLNYSATQSVLVQQSNWVWYYLPKQKEHISRSLANSLLYMLAYLNASSYL